MAMRRRFFWGRATATRGPGLLQVWGWRMRRRPPSRSAGRPGATAPPAGPLRRLAAGFLVLLVAAGAALFFLDMMLWPTLRTLARAEIQNLAVSAVYRAVESVLEDTSLDYQSLFRVEMNEEGRVTFMQPDTAAVNAFAAKVAVTVQEEVRTLDGRRILIPLGRALGSRLLGGLGPRIPVRVYPVMLEEVRIWDAFETAGINQTRHRLYVNVRLDVGTAIPFIESGITVEADFPVAEAVIVGEVPGTYVGGLWVPFFPRDAGSSAPAPTQPPPD